jgi:hypothetical protein
MTKPFYGFCAGVQFICMLAQAFQGNTWWALMCAWFLALALYALLTK